MRFICLFLAPVAVYSQGESSIRELKTSPLADDSSFVYTLPYKPGKSFFLVQGYNSKLSHRGEIALDFKMRRGTQVCAMREGIVIETKEDSGKGGLKRKFFSAGNYILIRHADDSFAWYFHLKKNGALVGEGDAVHQGQVIGLSGNSGYSAFPHLHVEVVVRNDNHYKQLPMRFKLKHDVRYLRPGRFYRNRK